MFNSIKRNVKLMKYIHLDGTDIGDACRPNLDTCIDDNAECNGTVCDCKAGFNHNGTICGKSFEIQNKK
jgi:hypothetical protein